MAEAKTMDLTIVKVPLIHPALALRANTSKGREWLQLMLGNAHHYDYVDGVPYFDRITALEFAAVAKSDGVTVE